jgi:hypothetical protein
VDAAGPNVIKSSCRAAVNSVARRRLAQPGEEADRRTMSQPAGRAARPYHAARMTPARANAPGPGSIQGSLQRRLLTPCSQPFASRLVEGPKQLAAFRVAEVGQALWPCRTYVPFQANWAPAEDLDPPRTSAEPRETERVARRRSTFPRRDARGSPLADFIH